MFDTPVKDESETIKPEAKKSRSVTYPFPRPLFSE